MIVHIRKLSIPGIRECRISAFGILALAISWTPVEAQQARMDYDADDDGLIEIHNLAQLNAVRWDPDGNGEVSSVDGMPDYSLAFPDAQDGMGCPDSKCAGYELVNDLDFDTNGSGAADPGDVFWNGGAGWVPMDLSSTFDGGANTIANLYINRKDEDDVGLFGSVSAARVRAVNLTSASVVGRNYVGGLIGYGFSAEVADSQVTGIVIGQDSVGGMIGYSILGILTASHAVNDVTGAASVGGLVGGSMNGTITASSATGSVVSGGSAAGGLVGWSVNGTIATSYATGDVFGLAGGGGLVSESFGDVITATYTTNNIYGAGGGLVGNSYNGTITASYAIGASFTFLGGGLISRNYGSTITASYWDTQSTGQSRSEGGIGRTTAELQSPAGYTGIYSAWNVDVDGDGSGDDPWDFGTSSEYPRFKYQDAPEESSESNSGFLRETRLYGMNLDAVGQTLP